MNPYPVTAPGGRRFPLRMAATHKQQQPKFNKELLSCPVHF